MKSKKCISAIMSAIIAVSSVGSINAFSDAVPNPVISRNCPAYSQSSPYTASAANDEFYYSSWSGSVSDYLAYDLSGIAKQQRKKVLAVWYNATGQYDYTVVNGNSNGMPSDYTIEINKAAGGEYPEDNWEIVETVRGNTLHSRQHLVDMTGYNWIRMNVSGVDGKSSGTVGINFDIHNVTDGVNDSWIFYGDSITAGGMMNCYGTGFAEYINCLDSRYFPAQENGGIGGIFSTDGAANIDRWLSVFPGKYVSIAYGTNDAWGNQTGAQKYYENTAYMVEKVIEAGKTPIVPKIPYAAETGVNTYLDSYNAMIDKIYQEYPDVIKGPDFNSLFREYPDLLSADGVHPSSEGYDKMRQVWAETMYNEVYMAQSNDKDIKCDINLDKSVDAKDAEILSDFLLKKSIPEYADADQSCDVNSDGKINVFDLILLKRIIADYSESGEMTESSWKATESNVKLNGRNMIDENTTWLLQSGSAAEFTITGKSADLVLAGNIGIDSDADFRPRYAVYVDDQLITDETLDSAEEKITLFSGTSSVNKKVKIIMLSEAMYGAVGVSSINVTSASKTPVKPTAKKDLSIEFIGDSITCAYGVEGKDNYDSFKTTTENFTKSYAYLTAQKLNADYSAVCYSGHGIISGYSTGEKNSESLIPDIYGLDSKLTEYSENWDFESHKNDVVVINLGTNDINYVAAEPETRSQEFIDGYVSFLKTIRQNNSSSYIICTLGTMGGDDIYSLIEDAVEAYKAETNDEKIISYKSATQNPADGYGSDWHPSAITQQNSAYVLADKICQAIGIESDQVGLDVAADAIYDVEINKENGANAAFYVGYDKTFWINMVSGGASAQDIIAILSGISLKKDGEYHLEFDYITTHDKDITVSLKGNSIYFTDTINPSSEKKHYSKTFTVSADDSDSKLTFDIGNGNSYNVTLSNIKLTKIA